MILSKRERYIAIAATTSVALLALNYYVLTPLLEHRSQLQAEIQQELEAQTRANKLVRSQHTMSQRWAEMEKAGLKKDGSAAETQVLHAVRDWAASARLNLVSVKPEKTEPEKAFQRITVRVSATGTLETIGQFIWRIQTAPTPVKISDVQISSRKEGVDDLNVQLGISTIYYAPELEKPQKPARGAAAAAAAAREGRE